jgi:hypothetical protein
MPPARGSPRVLMSGRGRILAEDMSVQLRGPPAEGVNGVPGCLQHLPGTADDLPGDQERNQQVGQPAELALPADLVIFAATAGVPGRICAGLEQVDVGGDTRFAQPPLGVHAKLLQDPLARLVVRDEVKYVVALRRRVLRVAGHLQAQLRPVPEQYVAALPPGRHAAEEVARYLIRGQPLLPAEDTGDAVLALKPENALVHMAKLCFRCSRDNRDPPRYRRPPRRALACHPSLPHLGP